MSFTLDTQSTQDTRMHTLLSPGGYSWRLLRFTPLQTSMNIILVNQEYQSKCFIQKHCVIYPLWTSIPGIKNILFNMFFI